VLFKGENMITDNENKVYVECNCGCTVLTIEKWNDPKEEPEFFLSFLISKFYSKQAYFLKNFIERVEVAWSILTTGIYQYEELVLNEDEFAQLRNLVNKMLPSEE
jgi:hypothetical protein